MKIYFSTTTQYIDYRHQYQIKHRINELIKVISKEVTKKGEYHLEGNIYIFLPRFILSIFF